MGRLLIAAGVLLIVLGAIFLGLERMNINAGRLPGEIVWKGRNTTVYFPIVTCLLLSLLGTLVMWFLNRR